MWSQDSRGCRFLTSETRISIRANVNSRCQDWGSTPAVIVNSLDVADKYDVQVNIHTDTLNESGFVESKSSDNKVLNTLTNLNLIQGTIKAFGERTIHTYHTEGAGTLVW